MSTDEQYKWKLDERSIEEDYSDNDFVQSVLTRAIAQSETSFGQNKFRISHSTISNSSSKNQSRFINKYNNKSDSKESDRLKVDVKPSAKLTYGYDAHMQEQEKHWKKKGIKFTKPVEKTGKFLYHHDDGIDGYHMGDSVKVFGRVRMIRPYSRVQKGCVLSIITPQTFNNVIEHEKPKRILGPGSYDLPDPWKKAATPICGEIRATPEFRSQTPRIFSLMNSNQSIINEPLKAHPSTVLSQQQIPIIRPSLLRNETLPDVRTISEYSYSPIRDLPIVKKVNGKTKNKQSKKLEEYYRFSHKKGFSFGPGPSLSEVKSKSYGNILKPFQESISSNMSEESFNITTKSKAFIDEAITQQNNLNRSKSLALTDESLIDDFPNDSPTNSNINTSQPIGTQLPSSRILSTSHLSSPKSIIYRSNTSNGQSFSMDNSGFDHIRSGITSTRVADVVAIASNNPSYSNVNRWTHTSLHSQKLDALGTSNNSTFQTSLDFSLISDALLSNDSLNSDD